MQEIFKPAVLKALVVVTDKKHGKPLVSIFNKVRAKISYVCTGVGTANSEILDLFGLSGVDKAISLSLIPEFKIPLIMAAINDELRFNEPGRGIAFTIPISGVPLPVCSIAANDEIIKAQERQDKQMEKDVAKMKKEAEFDLVVAVIPQGLSEDLMDVARKAGASGGTILHSRRVGGEEAMKFFGISIQEEKEIVFILTKRADKRELMKEINHSFGLTTAAKGIILSLPVDSVMGLTPPQPKKDPSDE